MRNSECAGYLKSCTKSRATPTESTSHSTRARRHPAEVERRLAVRRVAVLPEDVLGHILRRFDRRPPHAGSGAGGRHHPAGARGVALRPGLLLDDQDVGLALQRRRSRRSDRSRRRPPPRRRPRGRPVRCPGRGQVSSVTVVSTALQIAAPSPRKRSTAPPGAKSSSSNSWRTSISASLPSPAGLGKRFVHSIASSRSSP